MKTIYIKDIQPGGPIVSQETFAVMEVKSAQDKNGRAYYDLILCDKTGKINAKIWSDAINNVDKNALKPGHVVLLDAKVDSYKGTPQLTILSLRGMDEAILDEYLQSSEFPVEDMWAELMSIIESVSDENIKQLLLNVVNDPELTRKLKYWPAAVTVHHDFRSGLLQHILEMCATAEGLQKFYAKANFDIIKAGIILHDIGKLEELDATGPITVYTKRGSLIGHMALGLEIIRKHLPGNFPENLFTHIQHIVLSHHGQLEYGSPVLPATIEALMIHNIDNVSADARKAAQALVNEALDDNGMSSYNRWLSTKFWDGS
jgi:3'-5' exoribonuclease